MKNVILISAVFLLFISLLATAFININDIAVKEAASTVSGEPIIVIDAGHGGFDGGAISDNGYLEKDLNLIIANKLVKICKTNGLSVEAVRTDDSSLEDVGLAKIRQKKKSDLYNRLGLMTKYDNEIFVSIHLNKFSDKSVHGAQIFYSDNFEASYTLADCIRKSVKLLQTDNNRVLKAATSDIYLLYNAKCPAVIVECGFLSNDGDLSNLTSEKYTNSLAYTVFLGINDYLSEVK